jgi:hypothetical protein
MSGSNESNATSTRVFLIDNLLIRQKRRANLVLIGEGSELYASWIGNTTAQRRGMEADDLLCSRNARSQKDGKGSLLAVLLLAERAR